LRSFARYTYDLLLSIEKLIYGGEGLARTAPGPDGRSMTVFVPFVLPGEKVEADIRQEKPGFARGSVTQLVEASPIASRRAVLTSGNAADAITSTFLMSDSWSSRLESCARLCGGLRKLR